MQIARGELLGKLNEVMIGTSSKEILQQSNCLVFSDGKLTTFNDDILARIDSPLDFDVVVNADDFMDVISKMPDDDISIMLTEGEIIIKGNNRKFGLTASTEVTLPFAAVPSPDKWHRIADGVMGVLQMAARTCGDDEAQFISSCVHITPNRIEACDNFRLFRQDGPTGFPAEVLIPAKSVAELNKMEISRVSIGEGWVYFRTTSGTEIACRCSHEKYIQGVDAILEMEGAEKVTLPSNLGEMVERAEIFNSADIDSRIGVKIADNTLIVTSRKETGWCKERKAIQYAGRALDFEISPKFLVEVLKKSRDVLVDERKMALVGQPFQFALCLSVRPEGKEE